MSGLAATLRAAEPGTRVRLQLRDGREIAGKIKQVNGESLSLANGDGPIELKSVRRVVLEFSVDRQRTRKSAA